ncbi:MAG: carbohydrate kinase [Clostridia bacterium]|nr:carbohydrate kinase [Clostridia bacterium]
MIKICAIGELLIDFTPVGKSDQGNNLFEQNPGGGPANVAVATSMLGIDTAFIGKVGKDRFGMALQKALTDKKVNMKGLVFSDNVNTTLAFVHLDENNDRSFSFYRKPGADITITDSEVDYHLIDDCELLHFSSVSMTDEPSRTTTVNAVKYAKEKGKLISFDPNLREPLWNSLSEAKEVIQSMLTYADILKISEEELLFLTGENDLLKGCRIIQKLGVSLIFATLGKKGAMYLYKDITGSQKTYDVKVVDTTGCGDSFVGAVLSKIMTREQRLEHLSKDELDEINRFANLAGSLTAMKKGGVPAMPSLQEVIEFGKKAVML